MDDLVIRAFSDAQLSFASHERCTLLLWKSYEQDANKFMVKFIECLNRILMIYQREVNVERLVIFVAKFLTGSYVNTDDAKHQESRSRLLDITIRYLISHSNAEGKAIRFRTCQMVSTILKHLSDGSDGSDGMDEQLFVQLQQAMMLRAMDRLPRIRAAAVDALANMQNPEEANDDPVTQVLIYGLGKDSSSVVRKACLQALEASDYSIPFMMSRTRDAKEDVRKMAYKMLSSKVDPFELTKEQRAKIVLSGLKDRSETVRRGCLQYLLLDGWFVSACQSNIQDLTELFDFVHQEAEVLYVLERILDFGESSSSETYTLLESVKKGIDIDNLNSANVLVLRALCKVAHKYPQRQPLVDELFDNLSKYADVVLYYKEDEFVSRHLLAILAYLNLSDEVGRSLICEVIRKDVLLNPTVSICMLNDYVEAYRKACPSTIESDTTLIECALTHIHGENLSFIPSNPHRALVIALASLKSTKESSSTFQSTAAPLVDDVIIPALQTPDVTTRLLAIQCIGQLCLLDSTMKEVFKFSNLFVQVVSNDVEELQLEALRVLIDLAMLFGLASESLSNDGEYLAWSKSISSLLSALVMEVESAPALSAMACEGVAKLLLSSKVLPDPVWLSKLMQRYYEESTDESQSKLCQALSVFFPAFAFSAASHRALFEEAFVPVVTALHRNPSSRTKSPVLSVMQYIAFLTDSSNICLFQDKQAGQKDKQAALDSSVHIRLATTILSTILDTQQDEPLQRLLAKGLNMLHIDISMESAVVDKQMMDTLVSDAFHHITDKKTLALLEQFRVYLQKITPTNHPADANNTNHIENNQNAMLENRMREMAL